MECYCIRNKPNAKNEVVIVFDLLSQWCCPFIQRLTVSINLILFILKKSVRQILSLKSVWAILLLFLLSCNDDFTNDPEKDPPSGYSLVSIDYTLINAVPDSSGSAGRVCSNNSENQITYTIRNDQVVLSSFFDSPNEALQYIDLVRLVEVPLPVIDATNSIVGLSDMKKTIKFRKSFAWPIDVNKAISVDIPAFTTYAAKVNNTGAVLSTHFTCTVEDNDTKEQLTFTGDWSGAMYYKQEIVFFDGSGNPVQEFEQHVSS